MGSGRERTSCGDYAAKHDIEWEKKGTHEKHLSVLDFEKKERAKRGCRAGKELSDILYQQIAAGRETEQIRKRGRSNPTGSIRTFRYKSFSKRTDGNTDRG